MLKNYRFKADYEIPGIKAQRGWYEVIKSSKTGEYHLVRKATNGQTLRWTEGYKNKDDAYLALYYPAYNGTLDLIIDTTR